MNWLDKSASRAAEPTEMEELDPALKQAIGEFKASVHAWSDVAYSRPRTVREAVVHRTWPLAAGWGLAAVLLAGTASGSLYEHHRRVVEAQAAAAQEAQHQRELAAQRAQEQAQREDDILASVDKAISREVPSAMEPLAALTEESETGN
jgi:hypothetical protein